jgi:hypothetical protein
LTLCPAVFDRHILSLDPAGFAQSLVERRHKRAGVSRVYPVHMNTFITS